MLPTIFPLLIVLSRLKYASYILVLVVLSGYKTSHLILGKELRYFIRDT